MLDGMRTLRSLRSRSGKPRNLRQAGFTLIELLVVIAIIGILTTAALPTYRDATKKARESVLKQQLYTMRDVIDQYFVDKGKYPEDLQALVDESYVRQVPFDPMTASNETWVTEQSEPDASTPDAAAGIYNVHSGSDGTALDGTSYSEW